MIAPRNFSLVSPVSPVETRERARPAPTAAEQAELHALILRAQGGDLRAQSDLVRLYTRRISGFVRSILRRPDGIEDVAQLAFIKAMRRLPHLRSVETFESWLFMLTRNTALDFLRRQRRRPATVTIDEHIDLPEPAPTHDLAEIHEAFALALAQLTPVDRKLILQCVRGETYRDMAAQAGLTVGAVKARLHRMRPFLRSCVGSASSNEAPAHVHVARAA